MSLIKVLTRLTTLRSSACQQTAGVLRALEQVRGLLQRLVVIKCDDDHRVVTSAGDDHFFAVIRGAGACCRAWPTAGAGRARRVAKRMPKGIGDIAFEVGFLISAAVYLLLRPRTASTPAT
jgi:hypothetical protein